MKVYKYKTLEGLINQTEKKRINLEEMLNSSAMLKGRGYCKFELSAEGREKFARMAAKVIKATLPAYINWDSERKLGVTTLDACQYPNKGVQTIDLRL